MLKRLLIIWIVLLFVACALPREEETLNLSIPNEEIAAINYIREGLVFFSKKRFVDAEFKFRQADSLLPNTDIIIQNLAATLREQGNYEAAEELLLELIAKKTRREYSLSLASVYSERGDTSAAIAIWQQILAQEYKSGRLNLMPSLLQNIASAEFSQGNEVTALCAYQERAQFFTDLSSQLQLARIYIGLGLAQTAQEYLTKLFKVNPNANNTEHWYLLSLAEFALGDYEDATNAWYQASAFADLRPDLKLKLDFLKKALLQVYPESLQAVNKLKLASLQSEKVDKKVDPKVDLEREIKSYQSILYSADSIYMPARLLLVLDQQFQNLKTAAQELGLAWD
jgi:tetratricopeptide (TPR) repeat protein